MKKNTKEKTISDLKEEMAFLKGKLEVYEIFLRVQPSKHWDLGKTLIPFTTTIPPYYGYTTTDPRYETICSSAETLKTGDDHATT